MQAWVAVHVWPLQSWLAPPPEPAAPAVPSFATHQIVEQHRVCWWHDSRPGHSVFRAWRSFAGQVGNAAQHSVVPPDPSFGLPPFPRPAPAVPPAGASRFEPPFELPPFELGRAPCPPVAVDEPAWLPGPD